MRKILCYLLLAFINALTITHASAQHEEDDIFLKPDYKSHFKAALDFLSNNIYYGRADDTAVAYITPSIGYYHKSGLFINASTSYAASGPHKQFDLFTLNGGYEFSSKNEKLMGSVAASKYFYDAVSASIKSTVKGDLYAYLNYDFGVLFLDGSAGANFADKTDFAVSAGTGHNFYSGDSKLIISPGVYMYAGTQHFYAASKNRPRLRRPGQPVITVQDKSSFKILDYELTIPTSYDAGKFGFAFTPSYAIPVNPVVYPNAPQLSEKLKNRFYVEAQVSFRF